MKKISTKINISILAVVITVLTFVGAILIVNMTVDYHRDFEKTVLPLLEDGAVSQIDSVDKAKNYLDNKSQQLCNTSVKDYYIFLNGNIVKSSASGGIIEKSAVLNKGLLGEFAVTDSITDKIICCAKPLENGILIYIVDTKRELLDGIYEISFLFLQALIIGIGLALLLSFIISKRLTASLKKLEYGAKRMSKGEFEKIEIKTADEVGSLCRVFNEMGSQIQDDFNTLKQAETSRKEFVANVSHELKTPLTVIKSYSQTLCNTQVDSDTQKKFLTVIDSEVDRMTDIVSQLLKISRLEQKITANEKIDLFKICTDIADTLKFEADKKGIEITVNGKGETKADFDKTVTVITNLLTNAVKYSKQGGRVIISVKDNSVSVWDNGIGIDKEDLKHVFERFYRTDKARSRQTGGSGLGLAIALECAKAMNARITVQSEINEYTKFELIYDEH